MNLILAFLLGVTITACLCLGYAIWQRTENERMMLSIIQGSPIPTFVIRKDHKILYWNKSLEVLSGIKVKDVIGTTGHGKAFYGVERPCVADLILDESLETFPNWYDGKYRRSRFLKEAYETTEFFPSFRPGGRWIHITAAAIRDSRGRLSGAIETMEDVTDRKHAEEELIKMKKLESLGTFASGVAQDFDSLLSAILRNIFLAKLSMDDEDKILEEGLAIAEKAGLQAKGLAHKLITFAKGGFPSRKAEAIDQLLIEVTDPISQDGNFQCRMSIPPGLQLVHVDIKQMRQVFENILQNSQEAMPEGGVIEVIAENVTVGNELPPLEPGDYVKVSIKDNGAGIRDEDLPRIFDPYFTTKKNGPYRRGTGLGLSVSHSILKNHHGLITVESAEGAGATFLVYLPVVDKNMSAESSRAASA